MRLAIISDPHGDLVALDQVLKDMETLEPVDEILLGGDLAQGGRQPAQTIDRIRSAGWQSVRGNSDDLLIRLADGLSVEEAFGPSRTNHPSLPPNVVERALWSAGELGQDRVAYLRDLPSQLVRRSPEGGSITLVHATPWSTEDVVLPDADQELPERMLREAGTPVVIYGHIHTQYLRRLEDGSVLSVGAVSGSNDTDARPAYAIVTLGRSVDVVFRRVSWPEQERATAYAAAGLEPPEEKSGPFPVRVTSDESMLVWPLRSI